MHEIGHRNEKCTFEHSNRNYLSRKLRNNYVRYYEGTIAYCCDNVFSGNQIGRKDYNWETYLIFVNLTVLPAEKYG